MRIALLVFCSGCIAASVKAHTGVVADEYGRGVQAGVTVGFGYAGERSAVLESIGFAGGNAPKAGLDVGFDYVHLPAHGDEKLGFRVGFGGIPIAYGDPASVGVRVASLFLLADHYSSGGHEKMFSESTRTIRAFGIEAMAGLTVHDARDPMPRRAVGGSAQLTYEMYLLSRMW
jgi:hypothetical protein